MSNPNNLLGTMLYFFSISTFYARGYFNKHAKIKNIIAIVIFSILILSEIRFGFNVFIPSLTNNLVFTFVYLASIYFIFPYTSIFAEKYDEEKTLDLKLYPELKQRDAEWLKAILKGEKYQYIAIEYKMSVGSVKNRFKYIFSIIECGDRRGFITSYADYEIIFHDEKNF